LFFVYGDGDTAYTALQDYIISLIEYYELMQSDPGDPPTLAVLRHLKAYLRHTQGQALAHAL
jgi:hypothetical protein